MFGGLRQRRHDIGERAQYPAIDAQRAARKSVRGEAPASRLQQRQAGLERERECAATRLDPLNALRRGGAGLNDVSHTDLAASNGATGIFAEFCSLWQPDPKFPETAIPAL